MHQRRDGRVRTTGLTAHLYTGGKLASALPVDNLSLGGAFLRTLMPLKAGTAVGLQFFCPGRAQPLPIAGKVVNMQRPELGELRKAAGVGVAFDPLTDEQKHWLHKLLIAHAPGPAVLEGDGPRPMAVVPSDLPPPPQFTDPDAKPEEPPPGPPQAAAPGPHPAPAPMEPQMNVPPPPRIEPAVGFAEFHQHEPAPKSPPQPARRLEPMPNPVPPVKPVKPLQGRRPIPPMPPMTPSGAEPDPEVGRLMIQVRGLLMQLSEAQNRSDELERTIEALRSENERLKAAVAALTGVKVA